MEGGREFQHLGAAAEKAQSQRVERLVCGIDTSPMLDQWSPREGV